MRKKKRALKIFVRSGRPDKKLLNIQNMIEKCLELLKMQKINILQKFAKLFPAPRQVKNRLVLNKQNFEQGENTSDPPSVRSGYLDISKAFDRMWHAGLLHKLQQSCFSVQFLKLIKSFLFLG